MKKYLRLFGKGLKYAGYLFGTTASLGLCYLQFVNSQVGPIDIDKQAFIKHYMDVGKLEEKDAT